MFVVVVRTIDYWGEPERAPPGQFKGCAVYLYISLVRRPHVITCSAGAHSMVVSFPDLQTSLVPDEQPDYSTVHIYSYVIAKNGRCSNMHVVRREANLAKVTL